MVVARRAVPGTKFFSLMNEWAGWNLHVPAEVLTVQSGDVRDDGHHACFSVVDIVAVRQPLTGIVRIEVHLDSLVG